MAGKLCRPGWGWIAAPQQWQGDCRYRAGPMPDHTPARRRSWPRTLLGLALAGLVLLAAVLVGALAAALQPQPRVVVVQEVSQQDVARALSLLRTHDPRRAVAGAVSTALVLPRDVEVLITHGARRWVRAASQVTLEKGAATLVVSTPAPANPFSGLFGSWLNLELRVAETGGLPVIEHLRLGGLPVPAWLAERAAAHAAARFGLQGELALAASVVRRVRFKPEHLLVTYAWEQDSARRLLAGLVPPDELERLRAYADRLAQLTHRQPHWQMPMVELLPPMFELARERSRAGGDAAAENRAALAVLTLFANNRHVGSVVPLARSWPRARPMQLTLAGRPDFPLHFLVSAALATESTGVLSQAIGLYKEVTDARSGSGFSFNDMAANRAGTRFGERLVREPEAMQQALVRGVAEGELVPAVADLPEFLPEAEFVKRFGGVGAPAYEAVMADIERRIAALPLLR
jgi:hypothetical protein